MATQKYQLTQTQKTMVFVLSMCLYGLSNLLTELIPEFRIGIVELSVEYFAFIPLTLCMLFDPLSAALGASTGEVIFGEIMLGQFGGFGEVEKFITFALAMYIAGVLVRDPRNKVSVAFAAIGGVAIHQFFSCTIDILKVQFAIEDFEAIEGLPQSVVLTEGFSFLNDVLFSGILFALLPTLYLVPRLYGKIEPLLGIKPRDPETAPAISGALIGKLLVMAIVTFVVATGFEFMAESGINIIDWEADWAESTPVIAGAVAVSLIGALVVVGLLYNRGKNKAS